jgi:hypothetical protein
MTSNHPLERREQAVTGGVEIDEQVIVSPE